MPEQIIYVPNPPPDPSLLPNDILAYSKQLDYQNFLPAAELAAVKEFRRAADYVAAGAFR